MAVLQPKAHLRETTLTIQRRLIQDLEAMAEDKINTCPGGCARPALNLVAECAMINALVAGYLRTGVAERLPPDQRQAHLASFDTREKARAYLEQTTQDLLNALETLDENTLGDVSEPLGRPMSRFEIAQLPAMHMMYHDGQLNYLQTLHGDDQIHWT